MHINAIATLRRQNRRISPAMPCVLLKVLVCR